jgi:hypothetical protein
MDVCKQRGSTYIEHLTAHACFLWHMYVRGPIPLVDKPYAPYSIFIMSSCPNNNELKGI